MQKARILLVENDPEWLATTEESLKGEGYRVRSATSRNEAVRILTGAEPVDLAVFDLHLDEKEFVRDRSGLALARQFPHMPRVIWTAETEDTGMAIDAHREGIAVALKSRGIRGLLEAVRRALGTRVFLIHGHHAIKETVFWFLKSHGLTPIVLADQPSGARAIVELLEKHSEVEYAVALLTADDEGRLRGTDDELRPRARQNVVFELGFFSAAIGRDRVFVLCDDTLERPSDHAGVRYISFDPTAQWQSRLLDAFKDAGMPINRI